MKSILTILFFLSLSLVVNAQPCETNPDFKRANIWYFGYGSGLNFNIGNPIPIFDGQINDNWEGFSVLCDTSGNLLFYSTPYSVWNKNHNIVPNGSNLLGHPSSTQGSLLLMHPDNDSLVFLFTTPSAVNLNVGLRYNIINIHNNGGEGEVILKNKLLLSPTTEKLTAINHANGKDIWIIAHGYTSNSYFSFLLTRDGLIECPVQSITGNILEEIPALWQSNSVGNLISNYQGEKIAAAIFRTGKVEIFDFDNNTGKLKISDTINLDLNVYCVAYNGKGSRLYIQAIDNNRDTSYLYFYENKQLNLITKYLHGQIQYLVNFNEVIYIANMDSAFLSTIEYINDSLPVFNTNTINLGPSISSAGLPNFNQSYLHTPSINFAVKLNCIYNTIQFYGQDTFHANNHDWEISKQGSPTMTANIKDPLVQFNDTGTYHVSYIASNGSRRDTLTKEVTIFPKIDKNFLGNDTGWCGSINSSLTLQVPDNMHCYEWSNGSTGSSITADTTGTYWAKIVTPNFCVLYDTITITIDTIPNTPTIYKDNDTLKTDDLSHKYQWFRNDMAIGVNQPYLVITDTGIYHLRIMNTGGCTASSDTIHIPAEKDTLNDNVSIVIFDGIKIYPNPFNNSVIIENPNLEYVQLNIYSIEGRVTVNKRLHNNLDVINTEHWTVGIYLIKLTSQNGLTRTFKLIKISE